MTPRTAGVDRYAKYLLTGPLNVSIHLTNPTVEFSALCKALAEHNTQIRRFKLTAHTAMMAGAIVHDVFLNAEPIQALEILGVLLECESSDPLDAIWPRLDLVLADADTKFPNLRKLHMNSFYDSVPMLPLSASLSFMTTLVLDGSLEKVISSPPLIAALLHCTPQLESLWMKHHYWENLKDVSDWGEVKGRSGIPPNIQLPKLKHLAVSVPGTACDLIGCITAPALKNLHLDGSRGPTYGDSPERPDVEWSEWVVRSLHNALNLFAQRCQNVRRFAVTRTYLSQAGWEWILFGEDGSRPPFPMLESISLHGMFRSVHRTWNGFDDQLLEKFARDPKIPLKRLVFLNCKFPLKASVLAEAFRASGAKELECDMYVPQWEDEGEQLKELGVSLTRWHPSAVVEDKWWTHGHSVDVTDDEVYDLVITLRIITCAQQGHPAR